ncbi:MAG: PEP-CTERM sorting domain-containing protein [Verrucomicrobia bacterium]|nr:PEP-CTERM sorting domain-containing protein [Verrucomicrobiota bacterium]
MATAAAQTVLSGLYNGSVITGDIILNSSTTATFTGGVTFSGANATFGNYSTLYWYQDGTLAGKNLTFGSGGAYASLTVGNGTLGNTLTLGSTTATSGYAYLYANTNSTIVNQGTISGNIYLYGTTGSTLTNSGTLNQSNGSGYFYGPSATNATGGTILVNGSGSFSFGYYSGETTTNQSGASIIVDGSIAAAYLHSLNNQGTVTAQNGGVVRFTGNNTTASLGSVTLASGGHAQLGNTLDNSAATLNGPTGGTYELAGGTISGGTIAAGALTFTNSGGTLSGVTYTGNLVLPGSSYFSFTGNSTFTGSSLTLGDYSSVNWSQDATLAGKTLTFGTGGYASFNVGNGNTVTFDPATALNGYMYVYGSTGATITNQGTMTGNVYFYGTTSANLTNQGTINQTSGSGYFYAPTATNAAGGVINVSAGASLTFGYYNGETTTNQAGGSITVDGAGSFVYLHGLNNLGTVTAQNGGVLQFTGSMPTSYLGNVSLSSGGLARLNNTLDNTAATLTAPTGGAYQLYGGTINNGTIGAGALTFTGSGGTLSGVSFTGDLVLPGSTYVTFINGSTFTGANATIGNYGELDWNQNGTLAGKTFTMGSGGAYGALRVNGAYSLVFDSATSLTGDVYLYGNSGASITNQGTINQTNGYGYFYAPTAVVASGGHVNVTNGATLYFGYYTGETTQVAAGGNVLVDGTSSIAYVHDIINQGTLTAQNSGVLDFTGTMLTTANLGNVVLSSGGRALLNGTVDNTAATLTAPTGGVYELYGGTISNGTIASGALTFTSSGGTLSGVTLNGNLSVPDGTYVYFANGTGFTGTSASLGAYSNLYWNQSGTIAGKTISFGVGSAYGSLSVSNSGSLTIDSASVFSGDLYLYGNAGSTITNQGIVNQTTGYGYFYGPSVTNAAGGQINVSGGATMYLGYYNGEYLHNAAGGSITVDGAGSYIYLHGIANDGQVTAQNGGIAVFSGNYTTPTAFGSITLASGGRALLGGALDNTGTTLNAPTGGVYELYGGTISNGTIAAGALTFTNNGGTLSGTTFNGNLVVPASTYVTFSNGAAFTGLTATLGSYATVDWYQSGTIAGKAFTLGNSGANASIDFGSGNNLVFDSATSFTGNLNLYGSSGTTLTNQGSLVQNSGYGYVYPPVFINASGGSVSVTNGATLHLGYYGSDQVTNSTGAAITVDGTGSTLYFNNLLNQGTLTAQNNGQVYFNGSALTTAGLGSITLASGGRALLGGTLDNTSATLAGVTGGLLELYGGVINNGSIAAGELGFTGNGGVLNNVAIAGDLNLPSSAYAYFRNGTSFAGTNAVLANYASLYLDESTALISKNVTLGYGASLYLVGAGRSLTIDPGTTITGSANVYSDGSGGSTITNQGTIVQNNGYGYLYAGNFTNQGTITSTSGSLYLGYNYYGGYTFNNAAGGTITVNGGTASLLYTTTNQGTINVQNGTLFTAGYLTNSGTGVIEGSGTINGGLTMAGGTLAPGNSVGTLTFQNGVLNVAGASTLLMEVSGATADKIVFSSPSSNVDIGAGLLTLSLQLLSAPTPGTTYTLLQISGGTNTLVGTFAGLANSGDSLTASFASQNYTFTVNYLSTAVTMDFIAVPEPGTYALLAAGLGLLGLGSRRLRTRVRGLLGR